MKPGQIQVFDGLRITTEHINHLQGSLHSAIQDIREILGLGKIHTGFEVVSNGDHSVTVQPGLAFDFQRNRVVCEQPRTLAVTFQAEQDTKYICAKYEQIEDGMVEGQPTLIWDSCSMLLRDTLPEPRENLVPLVVLVRRDDGEGFDIVALPLDDEGQEPEGSADAEETGTEETETGVEVEEAETVAAVATPSEETSPEILTEKVAETESPPTKSAEEVEKTEKVIEAAKDKQEVSSPKPEPWKWPVQQDVMRMDSGTEGTSLSATLLEPLRQKLNQGSGDPRNELHFLLTRKEISLEFSPVSLTGQTLLRATVQSEREPEKNKLEFQVNAQGEATFADCSVVQFGISTIQSLWYMDTGNGTPWRSEITEQGIAELSFATRSTVAGNESNLREVLDHLSLLVTVDRADNQSYIVIYKLVWKGGVEEETIEVLETQNVTIAWKALVAWKALGASI